MFAWLCKCTANKIIVGVNALILIFGIIVTISSAYYIYTYSNGDDTFFSKEAYAMLLVAGLFTIVVASLAIAGARDIRTRPNYIFCYWCLMSIILVLNIVAFYYFRTFILSIEHTSSTTQGKLLSVLETEAAKEFQDYILSTYTVCCTGCVKAITDLNCEDDVSNAFTTVNCPTVARESDNVTVDCIYAEHCDFDDLSDGNHGLGKGCYSTSEDIPNFSVGTDTCSVLADLTVSGKKLVGEVSNGKSCGSGDPVEYVKSFNKYFQSKYYTVAVPWGFAIALQTLAWLAAMYRLLCPLASEAEK